MKSNPVLRHAWLCLASLIWEVSEAAAIGSLARAEWRWLWAVEVSTKSWHLSFPAGSGRRMSAGHHADSWIKCLGSIDRASCNLSILEESVPKDVVSLERVTRGLAFESMMARTVHGCLKLCA